MEGGDREGRGSNEISGPASSSRFWASERYQSHHCSLLAAHFSSIPSLLAFEWSRKDEALEMSFFVTMLSSQYGIEPTCARVCGLDVEIVSVRERPRRGGGGNAWSRSLEGLRR